MLVRKYVTFVETELTLLKIRSQVFSCGPESKSRIITVERSSSQCGVVRDEEHCCVYYGLHTYPLQLLDDFQRCAS
jgi:hypothetical protein